VAAVQHTFTHKQYTEYRERYIHNKKKIFGKCGCCPVFCELYRGVCLTTEEKHGNTSVRAVEKCPDIPVAVVQYTFTQNNTQNNTVGQNTQSGSNITIRIR
jgi:hypothetical protein